ncbi:MAG: GPW/gp25 family protein [Inquilinus sp.]|uniref:GPW/gp25 family protein n=1 Tax=Inquilinus sp. TaxID=1932117 RepID=UPI003F33D25C
MAAHLGIPFGFDARLRTATTDDDDHLRDLIRMVLFTAPGERVNRPEFGCGVKQLVFEPLSDTLLATTQHLIQGNLLRWLGDLILVDEVDVTADDATLSIAISYTVRATLQRDTAVFTRAMVS